MRGFSTPFRPPIRAESRERESKCFKERERVRAKKEIEIPVARAQISPIISQRKSFSSRPRERENPLFAPRRAVLYDFHRVDKHRDSNLANKQLVDARGERKGRRKRAASGKMSSYQPGSLRETSLRFIKERQVENRSLPTPLSDPSQFPANLVNFPTASDPSLSLSSLF